MTRFRIHVVSCAAAGAAWAQDGPSFDCAKAESSAEEPVCGMPGWRRSTGVWRKQRDWIKGRDECWKADDLGACVTYAYLRREAELVALWMLEGPIIEALWQCGGSAANEVFFMYFETELSGIRVEYGDGVDAMQQSPAASGTRYDGSFGRYFWEKDGEAAFSWDGATEQACELVAG